MKIQTKHSCKVQILTSTIYVINMIIKLNKDELEESFDDLLNDALKSKLRNNIDARVEIIVKEIIKTKISEDYIQSKINSELVSVVSKISKRLLFKHDNKLFGYNYPYELSDKYNDLLIDKIIKTVNVKDLERAVKEGIKYNLMNKL